MLMPALLLKQKRAMESGEVVEQVFNKLISGRTIREMVFGPKIPTYGQLYLCQFKTSLYLLGLGKCKKENPAVDILAFKIPDYKRYNESETEREIDGNYFFADSILIGYADGCLGCENNLRNELLHSVNFANYIQNSERLPYMWNEDIVSVLTDNIVQILSQN